jgi:hypothetical protein
MSALILDAGALIAIDRGDRQVLAQVEDADRAGDPVRTNAWPSRRSGVTARGGKTGCAPGSFSGRPG